MLATALEPTPSAPLDATLAKAPSARDAMHDALATVARRWGTQTAWRSSNLTGRGTPVELAFTSGDPALRFTAETCPPDTAPPERLGHALDAFQQLVGHQPPQSMIDRLGRWQAEAANDLRYGAWVGGRFHDDAPPRFKLYVEVPTGLSDPAAWHDAVTGPLPLPAERRAALTLVGWESHSRRRELYFEAHDLHPTDLATLVGHVGLPHRALDLAAALGRLSGRAADRRLLAGKWGFSIALAPSGQAVAFTLYTFANTLFSSDANARRAILGRAHAEDFDAEGYARLSAPLDATHRGETHHGMIGISVAHDGPPVYAWGLAPPVTPRSRTRFRIEHPGSIQHVLDAQGASGAFPSWCTVDGTTHADENAFTTALAIDALDALPATPRVTDARSRALDFLSACASTHHPGAFHFYPPGREPDWLGGALTADVDDTALAVVVLLRHRRITLADAQRSIDALEPYRLHWRPESMPPWVGPGAYQTWLDDGPGANPVDACVNVNALTLLHVAGRADHPGVAAARATVLRGLRRCSGLPAALDQITPYYPHPAELLLALERAIQAGVPRLEVAAQPLRAPRPNTLALFDPERPIYRSTDGRFLWTSPVLQAARAFGAATRQRSPVPNHATSHHQPLRRTVNAAL